MNIYIPSKGRADKQATLELLPDPLRERVNLVVYPKEAEAYRRWGVPLIVVPKSVKDIGSKRQFIIEQHNIKKYGSKLVMVDDDIGQIATRRKDDPTKFYFSHPLEVCKLFRLLEEYLSNYAHVGVLAREGANRRTEKLTEVTRMMRVLAYDVRVLRQNNIRFDRAAPMEDFDVHLQLLRLGYKTACIGEFCQDQGSSNAPGGCNEYRAAHPEEAAKKLQRLHPDFVKIVEKTTKTAWGGGTRLDVQVQWKKAYAKGESNYARY